MVHAIAVTLYRVYVSKQNLLEWQTAYDAERQATGTLKDFIQQMVPGFVLSLIAAICIGAFAPHQLLVTLPIILLWLSAPFLAYWLSLPDYEKKDTLTIVQRDRLLQIAADTWHYFNLLLTQENNFLIPDNIQVAPLRIVAERTSPTNISLSILSVISAYDLGLLPLPTAVQKLERIFATLAKLERFHGHFLNWYQTRTLSPLQPRYVSTVDSGNLVGHLIAARGACAQFLDAPLLSEKHWRYVSLLVTPLAVLKDEGTNELASSAEALRLFITQSPHSLAETNAGVQSIKDLVALLYEFKARYRDFSPKRGLEVKRVLRDLEQIASVEGKLTAYIDLQDALQAAKNREPLGVVESEFQIQLAQLERDLAATSITPRMFLNISTAVESLLFLLEDSIASQLPQSVAQDTIGALKNFQVELSSSVDMFDQIQGVSNSAKQIIDQVEFQFLYDNEKQLFSIGYHLESGQRDNSFYDLMASESRLGSFVAIAQDVVPQKHWFSLGRSLVAVSGSSALVSWSGTMFEYLMPLLVMRDYQKTLFAKTSETVVRAQQEYGRFRGTPWGISESAYSAVDFEKTYQYRAFGVPALGLKRGLADDLVVAPYATFLALMVDPDAALKNITALEEIGMRGEFGFYDAVDFTPERLGSEENSHIVRNFMAHHEGMSLVAINNVLNQKIMIERFHSNPQVQATELLLQERFPYHASVVASNQSEISAGKEDEEQPVSKGERFTTPHSQYPRTRTLSNGNYTVMIDNAGNGFSACGGDTMLTRWRDDAVAGQYGNYIFIRDLDTGKLWSVAYQPTRVEPDSYEVLFQPDKIEFIRRDFGILLHTEVTVSPEDNVEVRKVTFTNLTSKKRNLEVTSYAEVALAFSRADIAHPAFSKMFIQSEYLPDHEALVFSRRPRSAHEERLYMMHMITLRRCWQPTQYETSRIEFLGRGNTIGNPSIFENERPLTGSLGAVLDPICSLRTRIELEESQAEQVVFTTGFSRTREGLLTLAQRYHDLHSVTRAFEMAWSHNNIELRREEYSVRQVQAFQKLITALVYSIDFLRGRSEILSANRLTQSGFWRFGVSGDLPIVLLKVNDPSQSALVHELLHAHQYIRARGIHFDLVVLNEYPGGYFQNFQEELEFLVRAGYHSALVDQKGGVFLRTQVQLSLEEVNLLESLARVVLQGEKGNLSAQLKFNSKPVELTYQRRLPMVDKESRYPVAITPRGDYEFFNGLGGFVDNGKAYQMELSERRLPPLPWANVIANPDFGFVVTESGGGYTWSENSRENKLTPWRNDPISDAPGEVIYIRDADQGLYWAPTPRPIASKKQFQIRHGFGQSQFISTERGIESQLTISGSPKERVKWWHLKLNNRSDRERRIELYLYVEWILGVQREESSRTLVSNFDKQAGILYACNHYNNEFAGRVVVLGSSLPVVSYTTSRYEFIGRHGDTGTPRALDNPDASGLANIISSWRLPIELSRKVGSGFDTCGVLKVQVNLNAGEERELQFFLCESNSIEDARKDAARFKTIKSRGSELEKVTQSWESSLNSIQIKTPDRAFDILLNGWLLYQTVSCRINGRSALYQSGGAMGFRDQLQDVLALLYSSPEVARAQILLHAAHQFPQGDVQHWWHPPSGRGVRTRISDDYLWLPYVVQRYLEVTGDIGILDEKVSFIEGPKLDDRQMESYIVPRVSGQSASIYEHCILALERGLSFGEHGLPLMGAGDWNDGMNEVGKDGKGESVWLGWFLSHCLTKFSEVCASRKDLELDSKYRDHAQKLIEAIELHAWDGSWYRRAFFDDGSPLGSIQNDECKIDSLSQTWSVIAGGGSIDRSNTAMAAVHRELVHRYDKIICLLTPPFDQGSSDPGYIKGYLPGVRENGGQYTHAAAWVVLASALRGKGQEAFDLFSMINPINHARDRGEVQVYQGEPYVLCGDVYSTRPHVGRAGWSWYTGSAGWMYQVGVEHIIGLKVRADHFMVDPCIPSTWRDFSCTYRAKGTIYEIKVHNPEGREKGVALVEMDGQRMVNHQIPFVAMSHKHDARVQITVTMGLPVVA